MQAHAAANSYATTIFMAPYYRQYDLPWSPKLEVEQRFRKLMKRLLVAFLILTVVMWLLPTKDRSLMTAPALPDRVVQIVIEKKLPPTPPAPKEEAKPEPKPEEAPKPVEQAPKPEPPRPDARKKAEQAVSVFDAFADLRDSAVVEKAQQARDLTGAVGEQTRSERALLTSKVGAGSGGINTASLSRGYGGGTGSLTGRDTTQVATNIGAGDGRPEVRRTSGSGKAARSREEVELIFDREKGAIYSIYTRALREKPDLKGKVVLELTISPTGEVINCRVISSELNDSELERRLVLRVRTFRFEPRDVETLTLTKPIDFFPAG
jgi:periplasmic protein TonB